MPKTQQPCALAQTIGQSFSRAPRSADLLEERGNLFRVASVALAFQGGKSADHDLVRCRASRSDAAGGKGRNVEFVIRADNQSRAKRR